MKKYLFLFLVVASVGLTSCSKDDEFGSSILGKWYVYSSELNGKIVKGEYGECGKDYTEFKKGGELESVTYNESDDCKKIVRKGTYSATGEELKVQIGNGETEKCKYSISGDVMTLTIEKVVVNTEVKGKITLKKVIITQNKQCLIEIQ